MSNHNVSPNSFKELMAKWAILLHQKSCYKFQISFAVVAVAFVAHLRRVMAFDLQFGLLPRKTASYYLKIL